MKHKTDIIGSTEKIDFPEIGYASIPAKIDTGADISSIWASDITLDSKGLHFVLFEKGSKYYNGKLITVTDYRTISIKNSSGDAQLRYKALLLVRIGKRRIRAWFTLADRSRMRYPVLLGKKLLRGKFVVDVSKRNARSSGKARVLMLTTGTGEKVQRFASELKTLLPANVDIVARPYAKLAFEINAGNVTVHDTVEQTDIADFDLVYFKTHRRRYEFAMSVAKYLSSKKVDFFDRELANHVSYDKLSESVALSLAGLPTPNMYCASQEVLTGKYAELRARLGTPMVCKEVNADQGRKNYLISNKEEFEGVMESADSGDIFMVQSFIKNDGYIRAFVFGSSVELAVRRSSVENIDPLKRHLNNPAGSRNARLIDTDQLPSVVHSLAVGASLSMDRQVAGVDLIKDKAANKWFILEVNNAPQLMSGSYVPQKKALFAKFIDFELNR